MMMLMRLENGDAMFIRSGVTAKTPLRALGYSVVPPHSPKLHPLDKGCFQKGLSLTIAHPSATNLATALNPLPPRNKPKTSPGSQSKVEEML